MSQISIAAGVDIEEISRFKELNQKEHKSFFEKVYTKKEIDYCLSKSNPAQHLAVRFAGKEAVIKVLTNLKKFKKETLPRDIEILNDKEGVPEIFLNKSAYSKVQINLSLSHSKNNAIAFAVGAKNGCKN